MKIIDVQKVFGNSVRVSRNLLGLSQEELAERSTLHRTYISDLERGQRNPSLSTILRLAHALEISVSTLFPAELEHWKNKSAATADPEQHFVDILLVEDDPDDVEMTLHSFKRAQFANRVHVVADGVEALDYVFGRAKYANLPSASRPQLILLDLSLPKLSGLEVLQQIKADKRTANIPVVLLTGSSSTKDIAACQQLGAIAYITKPVSWTGFGQAINKYNLNWVLMKPPESPLVPAKI